MVRECLQATGWVRAPILSIGAGLFTSCVDSTAPGPRLPNTVMLDQVRLDASLLESNVNQYVVAVDITNTGMQSIELEMSPCLPTLLFSDAPRTDSQPVWDEASAVNCPGLATFISLEPGQSRRLTGGVSLLDMAHPDLQHLPPPAGS
jgi:hypothetical protein